MRTVNVSIGFEIDIPDEELDFFLGFPRDIGPPWGIVLCDTADRDEAVWKYITAFVTGKDVPHSSRSKKDIRYMSLEVEEEHDPE